MCYFCPLHTRQHTSIRNMITVSTGPNLTESGPKLDLGFAFRVRSESARADPERTPTGPRPDAKQTFSRPRPDAKQTCKANPNFRSEPVKRTRGPLYVTELSIKIYIKVYILWTLATTMFQCQCSLKKISIKIKVNWINSSISWFNLKYLYMLIVRLSPLFSLIVTFFAEYKAKFWWFCLCSPWNHLTDLYVCMLPIATI